MLSNFDYKEVDFVILGTAPGLEQLAQSVCRQLKFNFITIPPNVSRDSINATFFRNGIYFRLLKPTHVFGFHDKIEESKSTSQLLSMAKVAKIEYQLITTKKEKK